VTGLADRGFGAPVLYALLGPLGSSSVIRFRGPMPVAHEDQQKPVSEWLAPDRRARKRDGSRVRFPTMRDKCFERLMSALTAVLDEHQEMTEMLVTIGGGGTKFVRAQAGPNREMTEMLMTIGGDASANEPHTGHPGVARPAPACRLTNGIIAGFATSA
jgi:hypothetical protein